MEAAATENPVPAAGAEQHLAHQQVSGEFDAFADELRRLVQASRAGQLSERGDTAQFSGEFRDLIESVNEMLDAILLPIGEGNRILAQISEGKIDELITETYQGDHEKMKQAVNNVGSVVQSLHAELERLIQASRAGQLSERGKADQFQGAYADIVKGTNEMLDAILLPIGEANEVLQQSAEKDLTARVTGDYQGDHAVIKNNLNGTLESLQAAISQISENSVQLSGAATELSSSSGQMAANAEETSAQANVVAGATEEINVNMQTVAAASGELSSSIDEISGQVNSSTKVSQEAVETANQTTVTVNGLADAAQKIGEVVEIINNIAGQTNLLALNATIEAARAGEAGKGFAVVAAEVKTLANETASATEEISSQVTSIQSVANDTVAAIKDITTIIGQVNEFATATAAAIEEQGAATSEISRTVTEASSGAAEIAKNITGVSEAAENTAAGASESQTASQGLSEMSENLQLLVGEFKIA